MPDIACLGVAVADIAVGTLARYPESGTLVRVDHTSIYAGGNAANTAMALAALGLHVSLTARVGADWMGGIVLDILSSRGIDISPVRRDAVRETGCSIVLFDQTGERSFITNLGANDALSEDDIDWETLRKSRLLHVGGALLLQSLDGEPMARILRRAKELGLNTCLDTSWDAQGRWGELIAPCLAFTDLFLPSAVEAQRITGESDPKAMAQVLLAQGARVVSIKMGAQGSRTFTAQEDIATPAFKVQPVSANGAGDSYVAGFIAGWMNGLPLRETAALAGACGAMATLTCEPMGKIAQYGEMLKLVHGAVQE